MEESILEFTREILFCKFGLSRSLRNSPNSTSCDSRARLSNNFELKSRTAQPAFPFIVRRAFRCVRGEAHAIRFEIRSFEREIYFSIAPGRDESRGKLRAEYLILVGRAGRRRSIWPTLFQSSWELVIIISYITGLSLFTKPWFQLLVYFLLHCYSGFVTNRLCNSNYADV